MALPLPSAPLQANFPRLGRSIRQLKKLYFFLTSLAVEACSSFADPGRRQYPSCTELLCRKHQGSSRQAASAGMALARSTSPV